MNILTRTAPALAAVALLSISACQMPVTGDALVAQCQAEVAPAGTYEYVEGAAVPEMVPVEDGTQAGADALNLCIKTKAAQAGLISLTSSGRVGAACPDGAPPIYGGATYCIGTN